MSVIHRLVDDLRRHTSFRLRLSVVLESLSDNGRIKGCKSDINRCGKSREEVRTEGSLRVTVVAVVLTIVLTVVLAIVLAVLTIVLTVVLTIVLPVVLPVVLTIILPVVATTVSSKLTSLNRRGCHLRDDGENGQQSNSELHIENASKSRVLR
jgi:hypothetical protein